MTGTDAENYTQAALIRSRVLVVDDFPAAAESLARWLRRLGHTVETATDGTQAIKAAESFHPDLVLLDLAMPTIDGYEVARRIRRESWGKSMLLVAVTGFGADRDRERSREAGFDAHLVKPAFHAELTVMLVSRPRRATTGG